MKRRASHLRVAGVILWATLAIPFVRHALESTMTLQMLVQIPLLALAGAWLVQGASDGVNRSLRHWNVNGISGLLLASLTSMVWMLPLAMDAAISDPRYTVAKFTTVPLFIGVPAALSWPHAGFVVRGVVLLEVIATVFRLGWLYLISPDRLCSNYLLDDQQQLGKLLITLGFVMILALIWKLMWGAVRR